MDQQLRAGGGVGVQMIPLPTTSLPPGSTFTPTTAPTVIPPTGDGDDGAQENSSNSDSSSNTSPTQSQEAIVTAAGGPQQAAGTAQVTDGGLDMSTAIALQFIGESCCWFWCQNESP